ncbi:MAG: hypothetical protein PVJ00_04840 [Desulfobacterales bacterium]
MPWSRAETKKRGIYESTNVPGVRHQGHRRQGHDGWGLLRASNTQPALVLRFEAMTENRLREIRNLV